MLEPAALLSLPSVITGPFEVAVIINHRTRRRP
jgi:hypothetical protein